MLILITGAAGFIGSNLSDVLFKSGHELILIDNFDPFYSRKIKEDNIKALLKSNKVAFHNIDIRDKISISKIFADNKIDLIIHLAAKAGVRQSIENPEEYVDVNINGTLVILESMRKYRVTNMVFASSSSVYGNNKSVPFKESDFVDNPISPYAATKKGAELLCHTYCHLYNLNITCLRFFTVYGPRQRPDLAIHKFTKLIYEENKIPFYGNGNSARDYTFIDDVLSGIINSSQNLNGYNVYNIGESKTITLIELINLISEIVNKKALLNYLPPQKGDVEITFSDINKARKEINYQPSTDIVDGLKIFVSWYLENLSK